MIRPIPQEAFCDPAHLSYLQAGQHGRAVVMLHGWGAFKELWWSAATIVGQHYRVFAPDMPGHGRSPLGVTSTIPQIAARIAQFCAAQHLSEIALVGHSMGGNVALELALAQPDLVQRLVLVSPAVQGELLPIYTRSFLHHRYGYAALRLSLLFDKAASRFGFMVPHEHGGGMLRPALRRMAYNSNHSAADMHQLLRALISNTPVERAKQLAMPTLVLSGALDPLVPPVLSRRLAASLPTASYQQIRTAAHNPMDECPAEFSAILLDFLHETC